MRGSALFTACYDDLVRYAARRVGVPAAGDVAAEVFLAAWRRRDEYDRRTARLWPFGVARRVIANSERANGRDDRLRWRLAQERSAAGAVIEETGAAAVAEEVRAVVAALPVVESEALRLIEWDGFTIAEAAVIAGCSAAAFRVRLHRGRRHAAAKLVGTGVGPGGQPIATRYSPIATKEPT